MTAAYQIQKENNLFKDFFKRYHGLVSIIDMDGKFIHLSDAWENTLGYKCSEMIGRPFMNFVHPDDLQHTVDSLPTLQNDKKILGFVNRYLCKDGSYRWVEWHCFLSDNLVYSISHDITGSKKAIEDRKRMDNLLVNAQKIARMGHYIYDIKNQYWESSETLDDIFGIDKRYTKDFNGWVSLLHPDDEREMVDYFKIHVLKKGNPFDKEYRIIRHNDKHEVWVHGQGELKRDAHGNPVEMFGIIQDITSRKNNERDLITAINNARESNRLKTAFLQNMSHEIRTPLNAIVGFSDLILAHPDNTEKHKKYAAIIRQSGDDLLQLINDILDLSSIETGQLQVNMEICNPLELFQEIHEFFINYREKIGKEHVEIFLDHTCKPDFACIYSDGVKLKQIFVNLINNAFKFTDTGSIRFGCKIVNKTDLEFYVSDTGIGIPAEKQDLIFERFMQIEYDEHPLHTGTGLGLAIVKGLINLLQGEIHLTSTVGEGSTFSFRIPFKPLPAKNKPITDPISRLSLVPLLLSLLLM